MSTTSSGNGTGPHTSAADARPVVLVRYRPGAASQTARTVHLLPLPPGGQAAATSALCGALLHPDEIENVTPGHGTPCNLCLLSHLAQHPPPATTPILEATGTDVGPLAATVGYRALDWPVTLDRNQIWLDLDHDAVALIITEPVATQVTAILTARDCMPPVLAHPYAPGHRVLLAGEPYGVALPCPPGVHRVTGTVLLPPTVTPRGPVTWVQPPQENSLQFCREIDLFGALRTALREPPPPPE